MNVAAEIINSKAIIDNVIQTIVDGMGNIHKHINKMAREYHHAAQQVPDIANIMRERCPEIPPGFLRKLDRIGSGALDSRVVLGVPFANRLESFPITEQTRAIERPLELLTSNGETLMVKIENLTTSQADQIFARDHIRTPAEQRAHLESARMQTSLIKKATAPRTVNFEISKSKKRVIVSGPCEFSAIDLLDMARKLAE